MSRFLYLLITIFIVTSLSSCALLFVGAEAGIQAARKNKRQKAGTLENKDVTGLKFITSGSEHIRPGSSFPIDIESTLADGTTLTTVENDSMYTPWKEFNITVTHGTFKDGKIYLRSDNEGATTIKITATNEFHPNQKLEKELTYNYKGNLTFDFSGDKGDSGSGIGVYGGSADSDPDDGRDGGDGTNGEDGPTIHVYVDKIHNDDLDLDLLLIKVINKDTGKEYMRQLNPNGSTLKVYSKGGDGGDGGDGEFGGNGNKANGANGGNGGNGGHGGHGGAITFFFNESTIAHKEIFIGNTTGGEGGKKGPKGDGGKARDEGYSNGVDGRSGSSGQDGRPGTPPEYITKSFSLTE